MRNVIAAHIDELHAALAVAPQTNEVGRSVALLAGLFDLVGASGVRRIRLLELEPARAFKAAASSWLPNALAADRDELPVVWHSVTQMYWSTEEVMAVERILRNFGARQRLGEVSLEIRPA